MSRILARRCRALFPAAPSRGETIPHEADFVAKNFAFASDETFARTAGDAT
jgi:hypothetical protein